MAELAIIAAVVSAVGTIEAGQARGRQLHLQAEMASLEGKQKALQYEQQANMVLNKLNATNSAAVARASAGGVQAFEGSAALMQSTNVRKAGREFNILFDNVAGAERMGDIQKSIYAQAANTAEKGAYFDAAFKLASAGYQYSQLGGPPGGAPVEERGTISRGSSPYLRGDE
jgi:hypothetical protein